MRSSLHGPYELGYTRATMGRTICEGVIQSQSLNLFLARIGGLQLAPTKLESPVRDRPVPGTPFVGNTIVPV